MQVTRRDQRAIAQAVEGPFYFYNEKLKANPSGAGCVMTGLAAVISFIGSGGA